MQYYVHYDLLGYDELKDKTNTLERMQKQHSLDIMELRAAI